MPKKPSQMKRTAKPQAKKPTAQQKATAASKKLGSGVASIGAKTIRGATARRRAALKKYGG